MAKFILNTYNFNRAQFLICYTLTFWESRRLNNYFTRGVEGLDKQKSGNLSEGRETVNRKEKIIKQ